jgi:hypothetical protein
VVNPASAGLYQLSYRGTIIIESLEKIDYIKIMFFSQQNFSTRVFKKQRYFMRIFDFISSPALFITEKTDPSGISLAK